ncbi:chemotaxis protein CheW [Methylophaga thiooxydans]|uniref:chemotaxis protein CheW n=1 Tax=Methylophaga thiooxydans TaxID=392484 RepID=UPI002354F5EC|nr:chemotaxis protein CheW [Methylophaga thiooxydans]
MESNTSRVSKASKFTDQRQVFTFFVEEMMFGLNVDNVLMLDQNIDKIQRVPVEEQGFCGVIKFQGVVVPVLDFAHRVGIRSGLDAKKQLLEQISQRESQHLDWVQQLSQSLTSGDTFLLDLATSDCDSALWFRQFDSRDETLNDIIHAFIEPHNQLHQAGEQAMKQVRREGSDSVVNDFKHKANQVLLTLKTLGKRAKEQVESDMRQVLLFITDDGKTPRYALLIDEINDVISYDAAEFQSTANGALSQIKKIREILLGIYSRDDQKDCLLFDINKLADEQQTQVKSTA